MKIAVNTKVLQAGNIEGMGYYIQEIFSRITQLHPEHEFIFIFDRPYDSRFVFNKNVTPVIAGPPAKGPISWKWWYDMKVPAVLKKYKADVFISGDECSLRTNTPQCLVLNDIDFLHYPAFIKKTHHYFYKHYTPAFLKKAKQIITVSDFTKSDISSSYKIPEDKIDVIYYGARDGFHPLSYDEKEVIQKQYTDGKNYFLYTGIIHPRKNLVHLLKAFSFFKKRQKSNMKLVLAGKVSSDAKHFIQSLKSYKYRDDVVMTGYLEDAALANIMGAAYALVYPSLWESLDVPVLEAMRCHVPVILAEQSSIQEMAGDAALYYDSGSFTDMADKIMTIYKDERLRGQLIEKGKKTVEAFDWDKSAEKFWECIIKSI